MAKRIAFAFSVVLLTSSTAFGQSLKWTEGYIFAGANAGVQLGSARDEATAFTFTLYGEPATVNVARSVKSGGLFDFTAGSQIRGNFGAAGTFFARSADSDGAVTATVPHPVFFDQARTVSSTITAMGHSERWIAIQGVYLLRIDEKTDVMFLAGPSLVSVKHMIANAASVTEGATPTVAMTTSELSKSVWGYVLAADVRRMITKTVGVGAFARYAGSSANMSPDLKLTIGGFQVGAGIRVQFQ